MKCSQIICGCKRNCGAIITKEVIVQRKKDLAVLGKFKKRAVYIELKAFFTGTKFVARYDIDML
jgi:hypothetical protein